MSHTLIVEVDTPSSFVVEGEESTFEVESGPESAVQVTAEDSFSVVTDEAFTVVTLGQPGQRGPVGPVGSDLTYRHQQLTPSAVWVVPHNLGKFPAVVAVDSDRRKVEGDVTYLDTNTVRVAFSAAFSGEAYCN